MPYRLLSLGVSLIALSPLTADSPPSTAKPTPPKTNSSSYLRIVQTESALPILTPALQERKTEKLTLSNGMHVYLISDPGIDQSAAGVAVEAGSWDDPADYAGTAHFLEHMLFMGTKAYPDEAEYMQFIREHGGGVNAFTAPDRTVYMLSINNDSFEEAIDRFSHFFIDPLLSTSSINRELLAVDQEHAKNVEHDGWRQLMIFKETGNPNHPNHKFSTGNAKTLSGIPQEVLRSWYEKNYSADRMHLVMLSPLPIEKMHEMAVSQFSQVAKVDTEKREIKESMLSSQQKGHMLFIKPVRDMKELSLTWEVPKETASDIDRKVPELVAYALNHQDKKGLAKKLKEENIAESIHVSCDRFHKDATLFSINITLTEHGLKKVDSAISYVFQALARLEQDGYPKHLFDEMQQVAKLNYQFQSREDAFSAITTLASQMPYEELATYPEKTHIPSFYDPAAIHSFLQKLTAEECIYFVIADPEKTKIATDKKEQWMQAEYCVKPVSKTRMAAWNALTPHPEIALPAKNPYLPQKLELAHNADPLFTTPTLIASDYDCQVYYAKDDRYQVPEIAFAFDFYSPLIQNTPRSKALLDLYTKAFYDTLSSPLSLAEKAGLNCGLTPTKNALRLTLTGYSDKAPLFLQNLCGKMRSLKVSEKEFEVYSASLAALYDNASKELPVRQAMEQINGILFKAPTAQEKKVALQAISYEDFQQFSSSLFASLYTESFLYGNLSYSQAKSLWSSLQTTLNANVFLKADHQPKQIFVMQEGAAPCQIQESTDRQGSATLLLVQEGEFSYQSRAIQQVLGTALTGDFFDSLRTKQQTGYITKAWDTEQEKQLLQFFAVQSNSHSSESLLHRFDIFLEDFNRHLCGHVPKERFESIRANLITSIKMPPENMEGMLQKLHLLAFEHSDFSRIDKRIESLEELSYEQFCQGALEFLSNNNSKRIAILMQGAMPEVAHLKYQVTTKEEIGSWGTFLPYQEQRATASLSSDSAE